VTWWHVSLAGHEVMVLVMMLVVVLVVPGEEVVACALELTEAAVVACVLELTEAVVVGCGHSNWNLEYIAQGLQSA